VKTIVKHLNTQNSKSALSGLEKLIFINYREEYRTKMKYLRTDITVPGYEVNVRFLA